MDIKETEWEDMDWISLAKGGDTVMKLLVP
jgi:hypothetical protein